MNQQETTAGTELKRPASSFRTLLESGFIFSAISLVTGFGNFAFQAIIGRRLDGAEFGNVNGALAFVGFLGLPLLMAITTVTHYIARFSVGGDHARLEGLLAGCRRFLFHLTIFGTVLAVLIVKPLGDFFNIPRTSLTLLALACIVAGLWSSLATALCQGMGWFKRLALIGLLAMVLRLSFGGLATIIYPTAEVAVLATGVALLANLTLLYWRFELIRHPKPLSPWDREFVQFLIVSIACVGGGFFFMQGDMLVANRHFLKPDLGVYSKAGVLARALPMTVSPLLTVLFTHRSGQRSGSAARDQLKLLGLYAIGLAFGAVCLLLLRDVCVRLLCGQSAPESAAMIGRFAVTMVFAGLLQALGLWALASRWLKLSLLYGALGLAYWLVLLWLGRSPDELLSVMPIAAGLAFGALLACWLVVVRNTASEPPVSI